MRGERDKGQVKLKWNSSKMCVMQFNCFEDYVSNNLAHWSFYIALWVRLAFLFSSYINEEKGVAARNFVMHHQRKKVFIKDLSDLAGSSNILPDTSTQYSSFGLQTNLEHSIKHNSCIKSNSCILNNGLYLLGSILFVVTHTLAKLELRNQFSDKFCPWP